MNISKTALIFFVTFGLMCVCTAGLHCAEYNTHGNVYLVSDDSDASQNAVNETKHSMPDLDKDKHNDIYRKYRITRGGAKAFIIAGGVCSGLASAFLAAGITMGFIPYDNFPGWMHTADHYVYLDNEYFTGYIDYPYMTAYGSVGISLVLTGALMFLFCMPLLIYGSLALYDYNKYIKQNVVSFTGNGLTIQLDNLGKRRML